MSIFITSDTHFFHKGIMRFCPNTRDGADCEEMTWKLVEQFNKKVRPQDELWFLGDVSFSNAEQTVAVLGALNGRKHLILGNHDQVIEKNKAVQAHFETIQHYRVLRHEGQKYVLFHFPIAEWEGSHKGYFHLYGHVHGRLTLPGRAMDVGIDARGDKLMQPWAIEEIYDRLKNQPSIARHGKVME